MTTAQELDRFITIVKLDVETGRNEMNEPIYGTETTTYRAKRSDVSDGEKFQAGGVGGFLSARFIIRSSIRSRAINASDELHHANQKWNIVGIKETQDGRNRFLEISATSEAE